MLLLSQFCIFIEYMQFLISSNCLQKTKIIKLINLHMELEDIFQMRKIAKKIRIKVITNRNLKFITVVRTDSTISDLASRALSIYLELAGQQRQNNNSKKQLTVSAVKQGIFYMPKSQLVANLLSCDDEVEVIIIKAKPKYPNQCLPYQVSTRSCSEIKSVSKIQTKALPQQPIENEIMKDGCIAQEPKEVLFSLSSHTQQNKSKKQKKRDKKINKIDKKKIQENAERLYINQHIEHSLGNKIQSNNKEQVHSIILQSIPKKKVKIDQTVIMNSPEKFLQMVCPSPKITFHNQPKIQSPKFMQLSDSFKKKSILQNQFRKQSEDIDKKSIIQKMLSPITSLKSPGIQHKTPNQQNYVQPDTKHKDRDQLLNFSLPCKLSEDNRVDLIKKDKSKDEFSAKRHEDVKQSKQLIHSKVNQLNNANIQKQKQNNRQLIVKQPMSQIKVTKSFMVVQADDSDSEQNEQLAQNVYTNHRQKQINQVLNKINSFLIQSDEEN